MAAGLGSVASGIGILRLGSDHSQANPKNIQ